MLFRLSTLFLIQTIFTLSLLISSTQANNVKMSEQDIKNIRIYQSEQLRRYTKIISYNFLNLQQSNMWAKYFFSPYISTIDHYIYSYTKRVPDTQLPKMTDIILSLDSIYKGVKPFKYALLSMESNINNNIRVYKSLENGAILEIYDNSTQRELRFFVENAPKWMVDNQQYKTETILEYVEDQVYYYFKDNKQIINSTIPYYKFVDTVHLTNPHVVKRFSQYLDAKDSLKEVLLDEEYSQESKAFTIKVLTTSAIYSHEDISSLYNHEFAKKYIKVYLLKAKRITDYRTARTTYYQEYHNKFYNELTSVRNLKGHLNNYSIQNKEAENLERLYLSVIKKYE